MQKYANITITQFDPCVLRRTRTQESYTCSMLSALSFLHDKAQGCHAKSSIVLQYLRAFAESDGACDITVCIDYIWLRGSITTLQHTACIPKQRNRIGMNPKSPELPKCKETNGFEAEAHIQILDRFEYLLSMVFQRLKIFTIRQFKRNLHQSNFLAAWMI